MRFGEEIPMRPRYGFVDDDGVQPENSIRVNPDPLQGMKAAAFSSGRRQKTPEEQQAEFEAYQRGERPTTTTNYTKLPPRVGTNNGVQLMNPGSYTDDEVAAINKYGARDARAHQSLTGGVVGGEQFSMPASNRITDAKARRYIDTRNRQKVKDDELDARSKAADEAFYKQGLDESALRVKQAADDQAANEAMRERQAKRDEAEFQRSRTVKADKIAEKRAGMSDELTAAQIALAKRELDPVYIEQQKAQKRNEAFAGSTVPALREAGTAGLAKDYNMPQLAQAGAQTFDERIAPLKKRVMEYQALASAGGSKGYGLIRSGEDVRKAEVKRRQILSEAQKMGFDESLLQQLEAEMESGRTSNGFWSGLGHLISLDF